MNIKARIFIQEHGKYIAVLIASIFILNLLPLMALAPRPGFSSKEIPLILNSYGNGIAYYDARIREIKDGFPFLGNPWFLEHNQKIAPAFIAADWLEALPLIFGASFEFTLVFGFLFWSLIFVLLAYLILTQLALTRTAAVAGAALSYLSVYSLMLGPTSMQIVYPFLLLFLLAFLLWLENYGSKPRIIFLIIAAACSFYIYTYLWQAALTILFLTLIYSLLTKNKKQALSLLIVIVSSLVLAVPLIIFTLKQIAQPYYWETMTRLGFIATRLPAAEAYYSGRWIVVMLILWALLWYWIKQVRGNKNFISALIFFALTGAGFEIVSLSNVITGNELELAGHMVRFITVWLMLAITAFIFFSWQSRDYLKNIKLWQKIIFIVLLVVCFWGVWQYAQSYILTLRTAANGKIEVTAYRQPLEWLENNTVEPVVVWANYREGIDSYIPILTKHYVLFHGDGILNFLSDEEAEERYLVAGYMNNLAQSDIEKEYDQFAGIGNAIHPYKIHNRRVKLCRLLFLDKIGYNCGELTDAITLKGKVYFDDLYKRYIEEIKPNINEKLREFRVAYIIQDRKKLSDFQPLSLRNTRLAYEDENFLIYKIDN